MVNHPSFLRPWGRSNAAARESDAGRATAPRRRLGWLRRNDRGAVGLELGIIAVPFFSIFLGVMEVSYDLYVQAELDNATELAARTVQVGSAKSSGGEKSTQFVKDSVCGNLGGLLNCSLLTVAVAPLPAGTNYYSYPLATNFTQTMGNSGTGINTGGGGQMMGLVAWYDGPTFIGLLIPTFTKNWNGTLVHETMSSAGFINEYFGG